MREKLPDVPNKPDILLNRIYKYENNLVELIKVTEKLESITCYLDGKNASLELKDCDIREPVSLYEHIDILTQGLYELIQRLNSVADRFSGTE